MLRALPLLLAAVGLASVVAIRLAGGPSPVTALTNCSVTHDALDSQEQEFLRLVNEYRVSQGRTALVASPSLNRAAAWMSEDVSRTGWAAQIAKPHYDSLNRSPFERMPDCGYPSSGKSENLALFPEDAAGVLAGWKSSPLHNANLLDPGAVAIGIGYYGNIWTLDFGSVDDSNSPQPTATTATPTRTPSPTPTATATPSASPGRAIIPLVVVE